MRAKIMRTVMVIMLAAAVVLFWLLMSLVAYDLAPVFQTETICIIAALVISGGIGGWMLYVS